MRNQSNASQSTTELVLEELPNGEYAWLRPEPIDPDKPIPYTLTDAGLAARRGERRVIDRQTAEYAGIHDTLKHRAAVVQQNPAPCSSVEIEQLAKPGSPPKVTVKTYAATTAEAAEIAKRTYDELVAQYAAMAGQP